MSLHFEALMAPHADQGAFGWKVVGAALLAAVPMVRMFQGHPPEPMIWMGCIGGAGAIAALAKWQRREVLHEVRLEREGGVDVFTVRGSSVNVEARGDLSARAYLGEVVARAGQREVAMPTRVLIVTQRGTPVIVLEEAIGAGARSSEHWPDARDGDLDAPGVPALMKSGMPVDLEKLRALLAR